VTEEDLELPGSRPLSLPPVALVRCRPGGPHPGEILADINSWVRSEALEALLDGFGIGRPLGSLAEILAWLIEVSEVWDYRRGGERWSIVPVSYDPGLSELIDAATRALGLTGNQRPRLDAYDLMLVLGGGPRTALARSHFAAALATEEVSVPHAAGLSSVRPLTGQELEMADGFGFGEVATEAEAFEEGMRIAFAASKPDDNRSGSSAIGAPWWLRGYDTGAMRISVAATPTSDLSRRANTADSLIGWADLGGQPDRRDRLLVVTTDLFVPFQHYDAVRLLGLRYGCGVETVGLDTASYGRWLQPNTRTALLQEVRSAILSMANLYRAVVTSAA
jgi:hypothetical protein